MGNNLKQLRTARGWTQEEAAQRVNVSRGQYIKLERGERRLTSDYIRMAAHAFSVPDAAIISEVEIPLRGYVDATAEVHFYPAESADGPGSRRAPALLLTGRNTVALEIQGAALGPAFRDSILYYEDTRPVPVAHLADRLCIVGLKDNRVCVRVLTHWPDSDKFSLATYPDHSEDCTPVSWAAPVIALVPVKD